MGRKCLVNLYFLVAVIAMAGTTLAAQQQLLDRTTLPVGYTHEQLQQLRDANAVKVNANDQELYSRAIARGKTWDILEEYDQGDVVTSNTSGAWKTYVSKQNANVGNLVTDTVWWEEDTGGSGGDITGVIAGTNVTGGGTTGDVTINVPDASTTTAGAIELADSTEAVTGTDTTKAITPGTLTDRLADPGIVGTLSTPATSVASIEYFSLAVDGSRAFRLLENTSYIIPAGEESFYNLNGEWRMVEGGVDVGDVATGTDIISERSATKTLLNTTISTGSNILYGMPYEVPITILSPADADDPLIDKAPRAVTLTGIDCVAIGGGTISVDLQECDANGTTCVSTGATIAACGATNTSDTIMTDAAIDSGDWLMLVIGAPAGTVNQVAVKISGTMEL